eukprot:1397464-Amphidinium_carterae.1
MSGSMTTITCNDHTAINRSSGSILITTKQYVQHTTPTRMERSALGLYVVRAVDKKLKVTTSASVPCGLDGLGSAQDSCT